jgi:hypothetical protein
LATRLRTQLVAAGETQAAADLEMAERSGVTSAEVISNVGVALQRQAQTGDLDRARARVISRANWTISAAECGMPAIVASPGRRPTPESRIAAARRAKHHSTPE